MFRLIKLLFTGLVSVMTSMFYFELPSVDYFRDLINPVFKYSKDLTELNTKITSYLDFDNRVLINFTCLFVSTITLLVGISVVDW